VQEVEEVRDRRAEALDRLGVDLPDGGDDLLLRVAADPGVEEAPEGALVVGALVDVGDAELGLPQECVVRAFEDLTLLRDGVGHRLQRRAAVGDAEGARLDLGHDLLDAAADGAEVLDPLLPQEPTPVSGPWIAAPALQQRRHQVRGGHSLRPRDRRG
jgi:hypothetical protein